MADFKSKTTRKTVSIIATLTLCFSALGGIGWGIYNISQSSNHSNDFTEGQSIEFNLRLYQVDSTGAPILEKGQPVSIYKDAEVEKEHLKSSASSLTKILQQKNLTNIKVSFGYSNIKNDKFPNKVERVGTLYSTFENLTSAFDLSDIKDPINEYLNKEKIYEALNKSFRYEIDLVQPSYVGVNYKIPTAKQSTGRAAVGANNLAGIYFDETTKQGSGSNFNMYTGNETKDKFSVSTNKDMKKKVTIEANKTLNAWSFVTDKNNYDALAPATDAPADAPALAAYNKLYADQEWYKSTSGDATTYTTPPNEQQKFQTNYTWLLWKDKQGLLNYLNSLIVIWYYNLYANEIFIEKEQGKPLSKEHLDQIFNTGDFNYASYVDPDTRKKINEVIKNLTEIEKSFIAMVGQSKPNGDPENPSKWRPEFIEEADLIPVLYNFYNSKNWNPSYEEITQENIPSYGYSSSVINGWGWLESSNSEALKELVGDYLITKIDYKSFETHFIDINKQEQKMNRTSTTEMDPYVTNNIYLDIPEQYSSDAINQEKYATLINDSISFPIIAPAQANFLENYNQVSLGIEELKKDSELIPFDNPEDPATIAFKERRKEFALRNFGANNIFAYQEKSKPIYENSFITKALNPFDFLMIILGSILFFIGIFISVRYRVPGVVAFVVSAFVFVMSAVLYNVFGFTFSFFSFIALAFGSFLSLLSPVFLCRNTLKEIKESSTISASLVKSVKKHWKTSLDFHIIAILCSISFLFFGIGGNINFGSMLIISVFLSFILSGIIFFVLMLFYTQYMQSNTYTWFLGKGYYAKLFKMNEQSLDTVELKSSWLHRTWNSFMYNVNLSSKSTYISLITFIVIAVAGVFVLGFVGSIFSIDFKNTNILVFKNFDQFKLSANEIIQQLNLSVSQSYVYNNELFIYSSQAVDLNAVTSSLELLQPDLKGVVTDNLFITTMTTDISVEIVLNTLKCIGIAIGFSAIWSALSLNIVAIIPLALTQFAPVLILSGFFGAIQYPLELDITLMVSLIFMITSIIATASLSSLKASWNRSIEIEKNELKALFTNILSKINLNYLIFIGLFMLLSLLAIAFTSLSLILTFVSLIIMLCWVSFYANRILVFLWYQCILLRNLFSKDILLSKDKSNLKINYDFVDEQLISGINK